jgi:phosphatidate cytidylyltransferase
MAGATVAAAAARAPAAASGAAVRAPAGAPRHPHRAAPPPALAAAAASARCAPAPRASSVPCRSQPAAAAASLASPNASSDGDAAAGDAAAAAGAGAAPAAKKKGPSSLTKRAIAGVILGLSAAVVIVAGGFPFAAVVCLCAWQCSKEFLGLVNAKGISRGMAPPPPAVAAAISAACVGLCAWSYAYAGRASSALGVAAFAVLSTTLVAVRTPRFSQLTSVVFGLLYCGYLPSYWIRLRLLAVPATNSTLVQQWVNGLGGGVTAATVGLLATFTAVACIIAADTGAYFTGKALGRTQLSAVSPKKTVEGAAGGLLCSVATALGCFRLFAWPDGGASAVGLGALVFTSSLFGDLIESVIKRDAGMKDASDLIPGHGGLLDRVDSYLFTGACVYFYARFLLRGFGVP